MRKLILLAAATLLTYGAAAQTTQGRFVLTGMAGYSSGSGSSDQELNGSKRTYEGLSYTLAPSVGYFVKDNLEIGASMRYEKHETSTVTPYAHNVTNFDHERKRDELRVYARQYKYLTERFALQATLAGGFGTATQHFSHMHSNPWFDYSHTRYHNKIRAVSLSPGIAFFPSDRFSLSANLGALQYEHITMHSNSWTQHQGTPIPEHAFNRYDSKTNSFGLDFSSWNLNFGLSFFIGK